MEDQKKPPKPSRVVAVGRQDAHLVTGLSLPLQRAGWELLIVDEVSHVDTVASGSVVLLTTSSSADWRQIERLAGRRGHKVVVLLTRPAAAFYRRELMAGASGVAAITDSPAHVVRVIQAAAYDYALIPLLALREPRSSTPPVLEDDQRALLRGLADGLTTEQLATRAGCSERTVYRQLKRLCSTLQVRSRDEAVSVAQHLGLLTTQSA